MIKTEMHGTGGGRWMPRAVAKHVSNRLRRRADHSERDDGIAEAPCTCGGCEDCDPSAYCDDSADAYLDYKEWRAFQRILRKKPRVIPGLLALVKAQQ